MKINKYILGALLLVSATNLFAAANSAVLEVNFIETRESGYDGVFFVGEIPDQGCTNQDRVIILESLDGGKSMLNVVVAALLANRKISVRVDGCVPIVPIPAGFTGTPLTSPKVVRVTISK